MARPLKTGLDYYSMDCDMDQSREARLLTAKHGMIALLVVQFVWAEGYKSRGYYLDWNEETALLIVDRLKGCLDLEKVLSIVADGVKFGFWDEKLYKSTEKLSSRRMQRQFVAATSERKYVEMIRDYVLIPVDESKVQLIDRETKLIDRETELIGRKVHKGKERKGKREREETLTLSDDFIKFKKWVHLNPEDVLRYLSTIGTDGLGYYIGQVDDHLNKNASLREGEHSRYFDKFLREDKRHKRGIYSNGSSVHGLKRANSTVLSEFARRAKTDPENFVNTISALLSSIPAPAEEGAIQ